MEVWQSPTRSSAAYHGLQTCGSVWACPVCSAKVQGDRAEDIAAGAAAWHEKGGGMALLSLTFPHYRSDDLAELLDKLRDAMETMNRTRAFRDCFDRPARVGKPTKRYPDGKPIPAKPGLFRIAGTIRALEVTHGEANGWHPHFHVLAFTSGGRMSAERLEALKNHLFPLWVESCVAAGLPAPSARHGLDVQDGTRAAEYIAKWGKEPEAATVKATVGKSTARELAYSHTKKGRGGSRSPFDLLRLAHAGNDRAAGLFRDFAIAFKGKRQLRWSRGLRDLLGLNAEKTDEELAAELEGKDSMPLLTIPRPVWSKVCRKELRGELLTLAGGGRRDLVVAWLREVVAPEWYATAPPFDASPPDPVNRAARLKAEPTDSENLFG